MQKKFYTAVGGTLIYALIGGLWILFSDKAVNAFVDDPSEAVSLLQTYKGWFFVAVTSILLFMLLKRAIDKTEQLLTLDPLTQLPRHYQFTQLLDERLQSLDNDRVLVLMYVDINQFAELNQEYGHQVGDRVLKHMTSELWEAFHEDSIMGRLGSDQFGIAKVMSKDSKRIDYLPEQIFHQVQAVSETLHIRIKVSIGLAIAPDDGQQSKSLLAAANIALHDAKASGEEQYRFYSHELSEIAKHKQSIIKELKRERLFEQLSLVYQPQINIKNQAVTGVEVLLRWTHPDMGFISPVEFIPLAEEIGSMPKISQWVITQAKKELAEVNLIPGMIKRVSINVSAKELNLEDQVKNLHSIFQRQQKFAQICQLEITETTAIYDITTSQKFIRNLKKLGLKFSIDDFGTGFTSLSNLKNLPVDELKIDRSFIDKIETEANSQIIVKSIVDLAKNFGINSIAEGVENEKQLNFLKQCGCEEAQGYYFAKPMNIDDLIGWLK